MEMITFFAHQPVTDFDAWINAARAHSHDEPPPYIESKVFRTADGKVAVVTHTFDDWEAAKQFKAMAESAEFQASVKQMGGKLPATIWLAEEVEF
jgi:heme-degrading monooxygenase HmoA